MNDPAMMFFVYAIVFVIGILITRAIFSIGVIVKNLKAQTNLLSVMAKKAGATNEEVNGAVLDIALPKK